MGKLHEAAIKGDFDTIKQCIEKDNIDMNAKDQFDNTALILAAVNNKLDIVRYLVEKKAKLNEKNKQGDTAVTKAAAALNLDVVRYLKNNEAALNESELGYTELTWAVHDGNLNAFRYKNTNLNIKDRYDNNLLMIAAANNRSEILLFLIQNQIKLDTKGYDGRTPLMIAAAKGHLKAVQTLVTQGASLKEKDNYGNTALLLAILNGHYEVMLDLITKKANIHEKANYGKTPLMLAAANGHLKIVQYLVENKVIIEETNNGGVTALIEAASNGQLNIVEYLFQQGAKLGTSDNHGITALMYAAFGGHLEVVQYLVSQGANPHDKDSSGKSVLEWARDFKNNNLDDNRGNILFNYLFLRVTNKSEVPTSPLQQSPVMTRISTEDYEALLKQHQKLEAEHTQLKQESIQMEISLRLELESVAKELEHNRLTHANAEEILRRSNDTLKDKNAELRKLGEALSEEIQITRTNIQQLEQNLESKDNQCEVLNGRVQLLQQDSHNSGTLIADLKKQTENLELEKKLLLQQKDTLNTLVLRLEHERDNFKQQSKESSDKLSQFNTNIEQASKEQLNRQSEWEMKSKQAHAAINAEKLAKEQLHKANHNLAIKVESLERYLAIYNKYGLPPEERAFQAHLGDMKRLLRRGNNTTPICYVSYAWEDESVFSGKAANELLQGFLLRLTRDLKELGVTVILDIQNLSGDIDHWMQTNIEKSDYVIVIGTERFKQRIKDTSTNLGKEWITTKIKSQQNPNKIIPILYRGDFNSAFPDEIKKNLILDYRNHEQYHLFMARSTPMGFLRTLFGICQNSSNATLQDDYEILWQKFKLTLEKIKSEESNMTTQPLVRNAPWMQNAPSSSQQSSTNVITNSNNSFLY